MTRPIAMMIGSRFTLRIFGSAPAGAPPSLRDCAILPLPYPRRMMESGLAGVAPAAVAS